MCFKKINLSLIAFSYRYPFDKIFLVQLLWINRNKFSVITLEQLNELAYALKIGDQKKALSILRSAVNNGAFKNEWTRIAWEGWLKALESNSKDSLIFQLMDDIPPETIKKYIKNFRNYMKAIPKRAPEKKDFAKYFIGSWIDILKTFETINLSSEDLAERNENLKKIQIGKTESEELSGKQSSEY